MVLNDLRSVWDNVPFYGKAVAAVAVMLQMGAGLIWLGLVRRELSKRKTD
jgi:hypothetical protein